MAKKPAEQTQQGATIIPVSFATDSNGKGVTDEDLFEICYGSQRPIQPDEAAMLLDPAETLDTPEYWGQMQARDVALMSVPA